jgi:hypothetical protein
VGKLDSWMTVARKFAVTCAAQMTANSAGSGYRTDVAIIPKVSSLVQGG